MTQSAQGLGVVAFPINDALPSGVTSCITGSIPTTDSTPYPPSFLSSHLLAPPPFPRSERGWGGWLQPRNAFRGRGAETPSVWKNAISDTHLRFSRRLALLVKAIPTPLTLNSMRLLEAALSFRQSFLLIVIVSLLL